MNAEVLAVVVHHYLTATLVVNTAPFEDGPTECVGKVVAHETVTIVAEVETLVLVVVLFAGIEQRVVQPAILVFLAHHDSDRLLAFKAAVVTHHRDAGIDFPGIGRGIAAFIKVFHMHGVLDILVQARRSRFRIIRIRVTGLRPDVVLVEEFRIHADSDNRHTDRLVDKERLGHHFLGKRSFLEYGTAERSAVREGYRAIEFLGIRRRDRTILRAAELDSGRQRRRVDSHLVIEEATLYLAQVERGSHGIVGLGIRVRRFRSRLVKVLPDTAIRNTPAHVTRTDCRILDRVTDTVLIVNQEYLAAILLNLPVRMEARMLPIGIATVSDLDNVLLVAEDDAERLRGNNLVTKDPLTRLLAAFDKRITLQVRRFTAGIVNFDPRRILTVFVEPAQVKRRDFGYHESGIADPVSDRILGLTDMNRVVNRITINNLANSINISFGRTRNTRFATAGITTTVRTCRFYGRDNGTSRFPIRTGVQSKKQRRDSEDPDKVFSTHRTAYKRIDNNGTPQSHPNPIKTSNLKFRRI